MVFSFHIELLISFMNNYYVITNNSTVQINSNGGNISEKTI